MRENYRMAKYGKLLIFILFGFCLLKCKGCGQFEEGENLRLDCQSHSGQVDEFIWRGLSNGLSIDVAICSTTNDNCTVTSSLYSATVSTSGNGHVSSLAIHNVNRNMTDWQCVVDGSVAASCSLTAYVKAEKPTCESPILSDSKTEVIVKCQTDRAYPPASCIFLHRGSPERLSASVTYNHEPSQNNPEDFKTTCILTATLPKITQTSNIDFQVEMYPRGVNQSKAVSSDWTLPLQLRMPVASIASNCPSGSHINGTYIRSGSTATCKCSLNDEGYPPGQAHWYSSQGSKVGRPNTADLSSSLILSFNSTDPKPTFACGAESAVGDAEPRTSFSPLFAYGPGSVSIELSHHDSFNLCPLETHGLEVTCKVLSSQVEPPPFFSFMIDGVLESGLQIGSVVSTHYTYTHIFRPNITGNVRLTCKAENEKFDTLQVLEDVYLEFREPPSKSPVITIQNYPLVPANGMISVKEGDEVEISCTVDGGYPEVSNITLTCGTTTRTSGDTTVTLPLQITTDVQGEECRCSAQHVTDCYDLETVIHLNVSAFGQITLFTANGQHTSLDIEQGEDVIFRCEVDGELAPDLILTRKTATSPEYKTESALEMEYRKSDLQCQDTDIYECQALSDSQTVFAKMEIQVNIKCKPQLKYQNDDHKVYSGSSGKDIVITVDLLVYPEPESFYLRTEQGSFLREVSNWKYTVEFQRKTAPLGTLTLTLHNLNSQDFRNYVLIVYNEVDTAVGLKYQFRVEEEPAESKSEGSSKLPVGLGVGLGCAALVGIVIFIVILRRRRQRNKRNKREASVVYDKAESLGADEDSPYLEIDSPSVIRRGMSDDSLFQHSDVMSCTSGYTTTTDLSGSSSMPCSQPFHSENVYAQLDEPRAGFTHYHHHFNRHNLPRY